MNTRPLKALLTGAALGIALMLSAPAQAQDSPAEPAKDGPAVVQRVGDAIERAAQAAARGIERGARAAEHGIRVGVQATARGIERGAQATARVADAVAKKVDAAPAPAAPAALPKPGTGV